MVTKQKTPLAGSVSPPLTCTAVEDCTSPAVLQAQRTCDSCGGESTNLRDNAKVRRDELDQIEQRQEQIKTQARARDGQCGCGDPSSHDGSPPPRRKRARTAEDFVSRPTPCPRPQSAAFTELEQLDLQICASRRRELGEQLDGLDAAAERIATEHTHPVFACEKHKARLPK